MVSFEVGDTPLSAMPLTSFEVFQIASLSTAGECHTRKGPLHSGIWSRPHGQETIMALKCGDSGLGPAKMKVTQEIACIACLTISES